MAANAQSTSIIMWSTLSITNFKADNIITVTTILDTLSSKLYITFIFSGCYNFQIIDLLQRRCSSLHKIVWFNIENKTIIIFLMQWDHQCFSPPDIKQKVYLLLHVTWVLLASDLIQKEASKMKIWHDLFPSWWEGWHIHIVKHSFLPITLAYLTH